MIKVGSELIWLLVAIEPKNRQILKVDISFARNMFIAERYLSNLLEEHGKHRF
jgi:putative transposase